MTRSVIVGSGSNVPTRCITNQMMSTVFDTSDEWIRTRTGIQERHIIAKGESTSDMSKIAALEAMEQAKVKPEEIEIIINATVFILDFGRVNLV